MSNAVESAGENGGGDRPAKKPKHNETEAFGGPMDDEETARKKLEKAGFDPDRSVNAISAIQIEGLAENHRPISYFCSIGDLMMCRYLLSKGASTTQSWVDDYDDDDESEGGNLCCSPMFAAARGGHLEVCKWLCDHGARGDIRMINDVYISPLHIAIRKNHNMYEQDESGRYRHICRWLILNEALCPDDDGVVCLDRVREALWGYSTTFLQNWARDAITEHDNFLVFLMGTFPPAQFTTEELRKLLNQKLRSPNSVSTIMESLSEHQHLSLWNSEQRQPSMVQCLSGHPGIRKHIADMIGVARGRNLRIMRGLERVLLISGIL